MCVLCLYRQKMTEIKRFMAAANLFVSPRLYQSLSESITLELLMNSDFGDLGVIGKNHLWLTSLCSDKSLCLRMTFLICSASHYYICEQQPFLVLPPFSSKIIDMLIIFSEPGEIYLLRLWANEQLPRSLTLWCFSTECCYATLCQIFFLFWNTF